MDTVDPLLEVMGDSLAMEGLSFDLHVWRVYWRVGEVSLPERIHVPAVTKGCLLEDRGAQNIHSLRD